MKALRSTLIQSGSKYKQVYLIHFNATLFLMQKYGVEFKSTDINDKNRLFHREHCAGFKT